MGFEEARVREQVATALEEAIESGNLAPGSRGFARRQAEVAKAALREPWDGEDGRSRLRAVHLRRKGRSVLTTKRGRELAGEPPALLEALATELLRGENFYAACAELVVALILDGAPADYGETLAARVQPAVAAAGWRAGEEPPSVRDVSWHIAALLRPAEAIGVLVDEDSGSRLSRKPLVLTEAGHTALMAALRARALAPAHSIRP
jgi:hypothetical protein